MGKPHAWYPHSIYSTSTRLKGECFATLWLQNVNSIKEPSEMSIKFQVVFHMQNMQRVRKGAPCFQGYHSLMEKADTSKKKKAQQKAMGVEIRVCSCTIVQQPGQEKSVA